MANATKCISFNDFSIIAFLPSAHIITVLKGLPTTTVNIDNMCCGIPLFIIKKTVKKIKIPVTKY